MTSVLITVAEVQLFGREAWLGFRGLSGFLDTSQQQQQQESTLPALQDAGDSSECDAMKCHKHTIIKQRPAA